MLVLAIVEHLTFTVTCKRIQGAYTLAIWIVNAGTIAIVEHLMFKRMVHSTP